MRCLLITLAAYLAISASTAADVPNPSLFSKVFNYQGTLPIKDERSEEIKPAVNSTTNNKTPEELAEAEARCWELVNEHSQVTFALQQKVLDELDSELSKLQLASELKSSIDKLTNKMRSGMETALGALKNDDPEEYFDALFETSENIIYLSGILRDPKLDEGVFLVLVRAVSRLGRNNSALIQDFAEVCSFARRSPRPRSSLRTATGF